MGISALLDLIIGLTFIFLIFSLLVSGLHEVGARALALRSKQLWSALYDLLDSEGVGEKTSKIDRAKDAVLGKTTEKRDRRPDTHSVANGRWTERLYQHPLIRKLDDTTTMEKARLSHIDSEDFARALLDLVLEDATDPNAQITDIEDIEAAIKKVKAAVDADASASAPFLDDLLVFARQLGGDFDKIKDQVSQWFDTRMDALSRSYRKQTRWWMFGLGIVIAVSFNVDAINVTQELYNDDALRQAVATQAESIVKACEAEHDADSEDQDSADDFVASSDEVITCVDTEVGKIADTLSLPVGHEDGFEMSLGSVFGWVVAAAALAQGGPFWFDALSRVSGLKNRLQ